MSLTLRRLIDENGKLQSHYWEEGPHSYTSDHLTAKIDIHDLELTWRWLHYSPSPLMSELVATTELPAGTELFHLSQYGRVSKGRVATYGQLLHAMKIELGTPLRLRQNGSSIEYATV